MGLGAAALATNQRKELPGPPGPPFDPASADNGLSVDAVSGKIVLGNDVGDAAQPAALVSNREIVTEDAIGNLFSLALRAIQNLGTTSLDGISVILSGDPGGVPFIRVISQGGGDSDITSISAGGAARVQATGTVGGVGQLIVSGGNDVLTVSANGLGHITFTVGNIDVWSINTTTFFTQIGPTLLADNGATLQVTGDLTYRLVISSKGAGTYNVDRDLDSNKQFINSAAATFAMPNMVGSDNRAGFIFRLCVKNVAGVVIQAFAGQVIRFGSLASSAGGTLTSTDVGAYTTLIWDNSNWICETFNGAWNIT